jgi:hypothetical protein
LQGKRFEQHLAAAFAVVAAVEVKTTTTTT